MPAIKERPILFNAHMVRAILEGRKSVTRRVIKEQPHIDTSGNFCVGRSNYGQDGYGNPVTKHFINGCCPHGKPGERLWVRETWQAFFDDEVPAGRPRGPRHSMGIPAQPDRKSFAFYRADGQGPTHSDGHPPRWVPSIHMPRKYSRILLEVTDVRVERLNDINEDQALAEGIQPFGDGNGFHLVDGRFYTDHPVESFAGLWQSISGEESWRANPWVWVVEFKRVKP